MEVLFPDIYAMVQHHHKTITDHWTPQGWQFIFRRQVNDWEIQRVADFFKHRDHVKGLSTDDDRLRWKGSKKGQFRVNNAYNWMNHTNLSIQKWPWRGIWKTRIP